MGEAENWNEITAEDQPQTHSEERAQYYSFALLQRTSLILTQTYLHATL